MAYMAWDILYFHLLDTCLAYSVSRILTAGKKMYDILLTLTYVDLINLQ